MRRSTNNFASRFINSTTAKLNNNVSRRHIVKQLSSKEVIHMEHKYSAHNYHPLEVVLERGQGCYVWDCEGKRYYDFLSAYSAVNQGHCHPRIIQTLNEQSQKLTLSSRAFFNNVFGQWAKFITEYFGYEKVLPMNTGAEAVETAIKLARRWGYEKKKIPDNEAIIVSFTDNFHGRTTGVISLSTSPDSYEHYGPYLQGIMKAEYNNIESLKQIMEAHGPKICGVIIEPIQGEAGVVIPSEGYLKQVYDLCKKHNVLFMADEIQTGIARTGKMLCTEWENVKADVLILGKALSGGVIPVSAVLADDHIMSVITPGTHGSTYGGNPLGCAVSMTALEVVKEENMVENSRRLGEIFRRETQSVIKPNSLITKVRGKGLFNAFVVDPKHPSMKGKTAYAVCKKFKENGLLAKQTHDWIIRFAPPLVINEQQLHDCIGIIKQSVEQIEKQ